MRISDWSSDVCSSDLIAAAGAAIVVPSGMRIVDARGATVTPGLIAVNTALGLVEVNSVGGSVDNRTHNSGISASFDVQYGLNPDSTPIPIARLGGITHAVVMPDYDDSDQNGALPFPENGRAACRERRGKYGKVSGVPVTQ